MDLDDVDWKIIKQLQLDGRKTFKELGEVVGFTGLGVRKRVEKLLEKGIIRPSTLINTNALDLRLAIIMLEMEDADAVRETIDRYKECPRIINFFTTLGGYNLIALVMAENQGTLESESIERCALRSGEGIRRSEFYPIGKVHHAPFLPLKAYTPKEKGDITPCGVDCRECPSLQDQKCVGCPSASYYKGPLR